MDGRIRSSIALTVALAAAATRHSARSDRCGSRSVLAAAHAGWANVTCRGFGARCPTAATPSKDLEFQTLYQATGRPDEKLHGKSRIVDSAGTGRSPTQPWALAFAKERFEGHFNPTPETLDPSARCFLHGVPRAIINREFEIFQPAGHFVFLNMAHHTYRDVPLDGRPHIPAAMKLWMGDSRGRGRATPWSWT